MPIEYRTADINFAALPEAAFDLIVARTSLHHVLHREHSADIPKVFLDRFDVVEKRETTTLLHLVAPLGTRAAYAASEDGRALFQTLFTLDAALAEQGILAPVTGQYILIPRLG